MKSVTNSTVSDNPYARSIPRSSTSSTSSSVREPAPHLRDPAFISAFARVKQHLMTVLHVVDATYESRGAFGQIFKVRSSRVPTFQAIVTDIIHGRYPGFPHVTDIIQSRSRMRNDLAVKIQVSHEAHVKEFNLDRYNKERARWIKEVEIMSSLPRSVVPKVYAAFTSGLFHITVMEFVEGHTVDQVMRNPVGYGFELSILKKIESQMHSILWLLWKRGLVHMDLHGGNVLIKPNGKLVVIDFGEAATLPPRLRPRIKVPLAWNAHKYWKKHLEPEIDSFVHLKGRDRYIPNGKLISMLRQKQKSFKK